MVRIENILSVLRYQTPVLGEHFAGDGVVDGVEIREGEDSGTLVEVQFESKPYNSAFWGLCNFDSPSLAGEVTEMFKELKALCESELKKVAGRPKVICVPKRSDIYGVWTLVETEPYGKFHFTCKISVKVK